MKDQRSNKGANEGAAANRRLLIALNAAELSRQAICNLALDPSLWWGPARRVADATIAGRLDQKVETVARARAVAARAAELAGREEERAHALGARILTRLDPDYPASLFDLALPPPVLYVRSALPVAPLLATPAVAIVGSRRPDVYGREVASLFGRELARAGAVVVSGFARGVDAAAHAGALEAQGGTTIAVLGCGLGVDYPRGQRRLADRVVGAGALVTELPVGRGPRAHHFPVRNRIIAALAQTVLVVRATARSGSLITARQALELGRDVAAVPGRIFAGLSEGPNGLLRLGALLAQHPNDLLETLRPPLGPEAARLELGGKTKRAGTDSPGTDSPEPGGPEQAGAEPQRLLAALAPGETGDAEALALAAGLEVEVAIAHLLELELGGWIRREPGGRFSRRL